MERCSGGVEVGLVLREERLDANFGDETETYEGTLSGITQSLSLLLPINMGIKSGSEKIISVSTHACMPS